MEQVTELCLFVKYTIQQYLPLIKDLSDEELHRLIINIEHPDFEEWLEIREPKGDVNRQSLNLHQCAVVGDKFMRRLESRRCEKLENVGENYFKSVKLLENRIYYLRGIQTKNNPSAYKQNGLKVHMTNIC